VSAQLRQIFAQGWVHTVGISEYRPKRMHNTGLAADGIWSTIGSIHFVNRSLQKNAEVHIAIHDRDFTSRVEAMVLADPAQCDVLSPKRWETRGFFDRIGELFFWLPSEND
jgi:phosphatidylserine/phosphatidylglycerophosphate/cardiolipin synthase-like enzyme